nr:hypothetical protein [Paenibacillus harenae]
MSKALRGLPGMSESTRSSVQELAHRLDRIPRGRTDAVANRQSVVAMSISCFRAICITARPSEASASAAHASKHSERKAGPIHARSFN